jgi:hypothetical protein
MKKFIDKIHRNNYLKLYKNFVTDCLNGERDRPEEIHAPEAKLLTHKFITMCFAFLRRGTLVAS